LVVEIIKKMGAKKMADKIKMAAKHASIHSSDNFYANQLKLGIWKGRLIKKIL
jgi:purine-nucleoside phosphorylase